MLGHFFNWYMTSLAEFWGSALRIGLPQILLVILLICWLRRRRCGKSGGKGCCWTWSCGCCGDSAESACCDRADDCGCTCEMCCCRQSCGADAAGEEPEGD